MKSTEAHTASSKSADISDREVIDAVNQQIYVDVSQITLTPKVTDEATRNGGSCGSCGANGKNVFKANHCGTFGPYGYGPSEVDCDAGLWFSLQRTSSKPYRQTYARMASCGTPGAVNHFRKTLIHGYINVFSSNQNFNTISSWASWKKGVRWKRRAFFKRNTNSGGIRAWTKYYKNTAAP